MIRTVAANTLGACLLLCFASRSAAAEPVPPGPSDLAAAARLLAGLDPPPAGAAAVDRATWEAHSRSLDEAFGALEERHLAPMRAWSREVLRAVLPEEPGPLFYPFGGPDLLSALVIFPDASSWTLVGLEPPGRVSEPTELRGADLERELARLRGALGPLVDAGYFVKKWMEDDLASEAFPGILPMLVVFLAREGWTPETVETVTPAPDGELRPAPAGDGVRLVARRSDGETREVVYLRQDLSDAALAAAPGFVAHLEGAAPVDTWIKAGHYLLHGEGFSRLRELLFASSRTILQDDSAIPWRYFRTERWDLTLFGIYEQVLPVYRAHFQPDLAAAYAAGGAAALPFRIGYHAATGGGPLILAVAPDEER